VQTQANRSERRPPVRREGGMVSNEPCRRPAFRWQREYWDTVMRDKERERKAIRYIENNPVKSKLCRTPEDWPFSSARFRDKHGGLTRISISGTPASGPA